MSFIGTKAKKPQTSKGPGLESSIPAPALVYRSVEDGLQAFNRNPDRILDSESWLRVQR